MRVSLNHDKTFGSHFAFLFLEPEDLPDAKAVTYEGTLSGGLLICSASKTKRREGQKYSIVNNSSGRVVRVPNDRLGDQLKGVTLRPVRAALSMTNDPNDKTGVELAPFVFKAEQLRVTAPDIDGIQELHSFRTSDGALHETRDAAAAHIKALRIVAQLVEFNGAVVKHVSFNGERERCFLITFEDGRTLEFSATGDDSACLTIGLDGKDFPDEQ